MEFHITEDQRRLQERCRSLAADFASRAAQHDREASHPLENYAALRDAGLYALNIPTELGGAGVGLLGYSLAAEELARAAHRPRCRSTCTCRLSGRSWRAPSCRSAPRSESPTWWCTTRAHRRQLLGAHDVGARRDARAADARPARGRRLSHHRAQGLCVDAGGRRLLRGAGLSGRGDRADRGDDPAGARRPRGDASRRCGTRWGCGRRGATPWCWTSAGWRTSPHGAGGRYRPVSP